LNKKARPEGPGVKKNALTILCAFFVADLSAVFVAYLCAVFVACSGGKKVFLRRLKRWLHRPKTTTVPLEALSVLWAHDSAPLKGTLTEDQEVRWIHSEINSFYRTYVQPYAAAMGPSRQVVEQILTMLDHHGDTPSLPASQAGVETGSGALACSRKSHRDQCLAQITLREHSLNVAREAMDIIKKHHKDYEMMAGRILIIALGHDLGLCSKAQVPGDGWTKSLLILEPMVQDLPWKDIVFEAISTFQANRPKSQEARILRAAEAASRKKELQRLQLMSAPPGVPIDINKVRHMMGLPAQVSQAGSQTGREDS